MKQLTLSFLLALMPLLASADAVEIDGIWYNLVKTDKEEAEVTYSNLDQADIPASVAYDGTTYSVTSIGKGAFSDSNRLTSVTIPNSVTSIGKEAFLNCGELTSVTIGNCVTSIEDYAFAYCRNLTSITIPNSVKSIGEYAFYFCSGLTSVTIGNSVTSIGKSAFQYCSSLTSVTIPNSVKSIGTCAFLECFGLTSVTISNSVMSIGEGTFSGCGALTSITIPNSVTSIGNTAFAGCVGLTSITIPNSVTNIESFAFLYCSSLTTISIGNGVKSIGENAFAQCSVLTDVYCKAEELSSTENEESGPLYTYASAFENSSIEAATLHVPESAINAYKNTEPWSGFGTFVTLSSEEMKTPKCATPTISYQNEKLTFSCATEDVSYHYDITASSIKSGSGNNIDLTPKYIITVYATKDGYEDSEIEKLEVSIGDANCDGIINAADIVTIAGIIIKGSESELK